MAIKFSTREQGENLVLHYNTQITEENNSLKEFNYSIKHQAIAATYKEWQFDDFMIRLSKIKLKEKICLEENFPVRGVMMFFNLSGNYHMCFEELQLDLHYEGNQHNMLMGFIPSLPATLFPGIEDKINTRLEIHIPQHHFNRLIGDDLACFQHIHARMADRKIIPLFKQPIATDIAIHDTINQMLRTQKKGYLKKVFLESKILELLSYQLEQHKNIHQDKCIRMKKTDRESLHLAKTIIENNIAHPCSLTDLAHKVGINDFKLKKGFKTLYGKTVFGYIYELRMQKARQLLQESNYSLGEIAESCGYSYTQHFITAFKKNYGITPGNFLSGRKEEVAMET